MRTAVISSCSTLDYSIEDTSRLIGHINCSRHGDGVRVARLVTPTTVMVDYISYWQHSSGSTRAELATHVHSGVIHSVTERTGVRHNLT